jgi:phosphonate transport system permease protein
METARRAANIARFFTEITPWPVRQGQGDLTSLWEWARQLLFGNGAIGWRAVLNTLAMSVVAISLASALGGLLLPLATRTLANPTPYLPETQQVGIAKKSAWALLVSSSRLFFILSRSIPEYIWAFLFVAMLPDQFWAAILALALHNAGILGRLGAEVVENCDSPAPTALRALGGSRAQILTSSLFPLGLPRFLVYFFYRWETCLREGTVLGMLGVATLGRIIKDARVADRYDEMLFFVLLGALLVLGGDFVSGRIRKLIRT